MTWWDDLPPRPGVDQEDYVAAAHDVLDHAWRELRLGDSECRMRLLVSARAARVDGLAVRYSWRSLVLAGEAIGALPLTAIVADAIHEQSTQQVAPCPLPGPPIDMALPSAWLRHDARQRWGDAGQLVSGEGKDWVISMYRGANYGWHGRSGFAPFTPGARGYRVLQPLAHAHAPLGASGLHHVDYSQLGRWMFSLADLETEAGCERVDLRDVLLGHHGTPALRLLTGLDAPLSEDAWRA